MRFEFATATRILFGPGVVREVAPAAKEMGRRALLAIGVPGGKRRLAARSNEKGGNRLHSFGHPSRTLC